MSGFFKFLTIFKTNLIQDFPRVIISDPVKIEIFKEARSYKVPIQLSSILPKGEDSLISKDTTLLLSDDAHYITLTARTKKTNPICARQFCENEIDKIITTLSIIYKSEIFGDMVYRGWLLDENKGILDAWIKVSEKVVIDEQLLANELLTIKRKYSSDIDILNRFTLMSKFYFKALAEKPGEEQFIWLWTILEVFPMKNTTDIKPISECLSIITNQHSDIIKKKLGIGQLFGLRSNLVHNGKLNIDIKEMGDVFTKLHNIVYEILRYMSGLSYSGSLNKYLQEI